MTRKPKGAIGVNDRTGKMRKWILISCVAASALGVVVSTPFAAQACKQGFVWRETDPTDHVCVTPETRAQTARDNALADQRRVPSSDTCQQGFVWREAVPTDHVCVTPQARAQAASDNAQAAQRAASAAEEKRFAAVSLYNQTDDVTIHFSYRWGGGYPFKRVNNFRPGLSEWFSLPLDANGWAPELEIEINEAIGAAPPVNRIFLLRWHAAPDRGTQFGHKYAILRDANDRDYVTVKDIGPPDVP